MLPPNVTVRRKAPGRYGVYVRMRPGRNDNLVTVLMGEIEGHAGDLVRDRDTGTWTAEPSASDRAPVGGFRSRDAAAAALFPAG